MTSKKESTRPTRGKTRPLDTPSTQSAASSPNPNTSSKSSSARPPRRPGLTAKKSPGTKDFDQAGGLGIAGLKALHAIDRTQHINVTLGYWTVAHLINNIFIDTLNNLCFDKQIQSGLRISLLNVYLASVRLRAEKKEVTIETLSELFDTTAETMRRYAYKLEEIGYLREVGRNSQRFMTFEVGQNILAATTMVINPDAETE